MNTDVRAAAAHGISSRDIEEIQYYLTQSPRQLPSHLLYDALGSALFEVICLLPWYHITRGELRLLNSHGADVGRRTSAADIVELGCGNGQKLEALMRSMAPYRPDVHLIDVSRDALDRSTEILRGAGVRGVTAVQATYEDGLMHLPAAPAHASRLVLFLGSNLGNFDPPAASAFVHLVRSVLRRRDWMLLGVDLVKPERDLVRAYDDPLGVTAAFNKNVLLRLNTEAGTNFDLDGFSHEARWDGEASRIEMHLVTRRRHDIVVPGAASPLAFTLAPGESIWTESSYKYEPDSVRTLVEPAGFELRAQWIDDDARFLLGLFEAVA